MLRVEYVIWIHDIHRICPLKLDLSPRKKIIGVAFDPTKLEAMEVEFFSHFEAKVEKCFFFSRKSHGPPKVGSGMLISYSDFFSSTSPNNLKNVFLTFALYFQTWKYDFSIQKENFKFTFLLKSCVLW